MKKIIFTIVLFAMFTITAYSQTLNPPSYQATRQPVSTNILFTSVASGITGSVFDLGLTLSKHTCTFIPATATAVSYSVYVYGGENKNYLDILADPTYTVGSTTGSQLQVFHIVNKPVRYLRAKYVSDTGASSATTLTLQCTSGGD